MDDLPIIERIGYGPSQRRGDFLLFVFCLLAPFLILWAFPDHLAYLKDHVRTSDYEEVWPRLNLYHNPGAHTPSPSRFMLWLLLLPIGCLYFLCAVLFKADQTFIIKADEITYERRSLLSRAKVTWPVSDIAAVNILTRSGVFAGDRYGAKPSEDGFQIEIQLKSGEKIILPVKRHYTHALRIRRAIENLLTGHASV